MGDSLGWSSKERKRQTAEAEDYIGQFGGPIANKAGTQLRARTYTDLVDLFTSIDSDNNGEPTAATLLS